MGWLERLRGRQQEPEPQPEIKIEPITLLHPIYEKVRKVFVEEGFFHSVRSLLEAQAGIASSRKHFEGHKYKTREDGVVFSHEVTLLYEDKHGAVPPIVTYTRTDELLGGKTFLQSLLYEAVLHQEDMLRAQRKFCRIRPGNKLEGDTQTAQFVLRKLLLDMFPPNLQSDLQINGDYPFIGVALNFQDGFFVKFLTADNVDDNAYFGKRVFLDNSSGLFRISNHTRESSYDSRVEIGLNCINFSPLIEFLLEPLEQKLGRM